MSMGIANLQKKKKNSESGTTRLRQNKKRSIIAHNPFALNLPAYVFFIITNKLSNIQTDVYIKVNKSVKHILNTPKSSNVQIRFKKNFKSNRLL